MDPDITYCVDINSIFPQSKLIYSKCGINQTFYHCNSCPHLLTCAYYAIKVTAVNSVGNGSVQPLQLWSQGIYIVN